MSVIELDCREPDGVTVGLIDGIIAIGRVLKQRDLASYEVRQSLLDMQQDEDLQYLFGMSLNLRSVQ